MRREYVYQRNIICSPRLLYAGARLPSGKGYADMAFLLLRKHADKPALLIELKWNKTAKSAIDQIKNKKYVENLWDYKDNLLLVGMNYDRETSEHSCIIERRE